MPAVSIEPGSKADVPLLEPLWLAVHHRHAEAMPELGPYVDDARSWSLRRALYEELLGTPDAVLVVARGNDGLVGYGLARVVAAEGTWLADTWVTGADVGEIESLAVLPEARGQGVGTRLLEALEAELDRRGVRDVVLGVLPGNAAAVRLYERRGYRPTWLYLSRRSRP